MFAKILKPGGVSKNARKMGPLATCPTVPANQNAGEKVVTSALGQVFPRGYPDMYLYAEVEILGAHLSNKTAHLMPFATSLPVSKQAGEAHSLPAHSCEKEREGLSECERNTDVPVVAWMKGEKSVLDSHVCVYMVVHKSDMPARESSDTCPGVACADPGAGGAGESAGPSRGSGGKALIHPHRHNLKNRFELSRTLGEGTYGKVKLAVEKSTGEQVAIKYVKKTKIRDDTDLNRIRREIQILSRLRHQHIVNIRQGWLMTCFACEAQVFCALCRWTLSLMRTLIR
ncbi:hypothetical protein BaRGS_00022015 [Batillaria attramentaria]|uniref:Protein kinase domain-containing protein n=1 Tax=Batillaria attramentaria TaxID=370345 RepID=A0ABD0KHR5_9CAEN